MFSVQIYFHELESTSQSRIVIYRVYTVILWELRQGRYQVNFSAIWTKYWMFKIHIHYQAFPGRLYNIIYMYLSKQIN